MLGQVSTLTSRNFFLRRATCKQTSRIKTKVMVLTESRDMAIGTAVAPDFELLEPLTGKKVSLQDVRGDKATLVMFICNHCPYVVLLKSEIAALTKAYKERGVGVVAISANSVRTHPQDGPEEMARDAQKQGYEFPYLYDETQDIAKAYDAVCTPEFYVFDADLRLGYHGQFDDARPGRDIPVTGADLRNALDCVLEGKSPQQQRPSIGCNIKWHPS